MRRSTAPALALLLGGLVTSALPAGAATPHSGALHVTDPAGDANGINDQGLGSPVPNEDVSTSPASISAADIIAGDVRTLYKHQVKKTAKKTPIGVSFTLTMLATPVNGVSYDMSAISSTSCDGNAGDTSIVLGYLDLGGRVDSFADCSDATGLTTTPIGQAALDPTAHTITWTTTPPLKVGATIGSVTANTSAFAGLGVIDEAASSGTFVYGR